mmetsp:Transcript_36884/g.70923  ORF Transcript_36884/g.70923 Transcript_36884/m.70923 type:complete len:84 (-) Transcript_36884:253-504(-)
MGGIKFSQHGLIMGRRFHVGMHFCEGLQMCLFFSIRLAVALSLCHVAGPLPVVNLLHCKPSCPLTAAGSICSSYSWNSTLIPA